MAHNPEQPKTKPLALLDSDPNSISRSPLNSSSSKMQYSIPKSKRFPEPKPSQSKFYDIPDTKSARTTSLGYGSKMELGKQNFQKPEPTSYYIKSDFDGNKKKGITISAGREIVKSNSAFITPEHIPGPGQYNPLVSMVEEDKAHHKGYSLGKRIGDHSDKWVKCVPGPGTYETLQLLDKNLKTSNSRIKNIKTSKFGKEERASQFQERVKQKIPGPGQYEKADNVTAMTKFESQGGYRFSRGSRQGIVRKDKLPVPGPGAYQSFSEFLH